MLSTVEESRGYDFLDPENAEKWNGLFVNSLKKVLEGVHPTLSAEDSALQYVESLCLRLLAMLCAVPSPLTLQDVEERVARSFPTPLDKWALADAKENTNQRRKRAQLPVDKLHHLLQKEVLQYKVDISVTVFMVAILEFVSADILKLAGNFVKKISKSGYETIACSDIKTAMCADKVLMDMFYQESEAARPEADAPKRHGRRGSLTYAELVRDLLADEKSFLRDLHLIIRVFKDEIDRILQHDTKSISLIFGNIVDIYELTVTLLGNLEDAMEMSQDSPALYIGSCFEELAEVEEFRAFVRYANIVTRKESREALQNIVDDPVLAERLDTAGHGFRLAVKYYLPKLLLAPVAHVFLYHNYVLALLQIAPTSEDRESFKQVECNLHPIKKLLMKALGNGPKMDATLRMASRTRRQLAIEKCNELARIVDNWDNRDIGQCCNEFIREDTLSKMGPGKRIAERRAYLFDGLLLLCKPVAGLVNAVNSGAGSGAGGGGQQLKLKEKLHIRKLELHDRPDTEEGRNLVELCPRVGAPVILALGSALEKRSWMCDLVMLNTKPMLDRSLDSILLDVERRHPLQLPPESLYRFAAPDSPRNILLDERPPHSNAPPNIKGATLLKLVERLTYHIYADLGLVRTFLTTYRSFCSPAELLDLLIERFRIPEPAQVYDARPGGESIECSASSDAEKLSKNTAREDWKRYRKEFQQPVKFRVINVLRHWVDQHFYDFERDPELLEKLREFLESVDGKPMKKWVQSVLKIVQRRSAQSAQNSADWDTSSMSSMTPSLTLSLSSSSSGATGTSSSTTSSGVSSGTSGTTSSTSSGVSHVFDRAPPCPLRHPVDPDRFGWHPLALHPLEVARQLTLLEFQLYKQVKPSELVGAVWTKKDKDKTSPNLLRIIKHTTNFTRWMEKWIVESENLEERVAVVSRLLELAVALRDLNNFNGVLAVVAACGSASVHRLRYTFQMVSPRLIRSLEEFRELNSDHFKRYQERLRSINPPCVPFLGMYLTNILHIEEGNLDFLPNSELINFSKRRKVAEITGEIQQYQNQPYCLTIEPRTRAFLESLDPFPGKDDNEITNYLYARSLEIEPRPPIKQMPKFPRRYPELKQVKVSRRLHDAPINNDDNLSVSQLSPPGAGAWDAASVASLPLHNDDHKVVIKSGGGEALRLDSPAPAAAELRAKSSGGVIESRDFFAVAGVLRLLGFLMAFFGGGGAADTTDDASNSESDLFFSNEEKLKRIPKNQVGKTLLMSFQIKRNETHEKTIKPDHKDINNVMEVKEHDVLSSKCEERSLASPRLERAGSNSFGQLSLLDKGFALFDKGKSTASLNTKGLKDEPPSPRDKHSPKHDRTGSIGGERKPQALSPRGAIVDAELFYSRTLRKPDQPERVPPLLPRTSPGAPPPPPRPSSPKLHAANATWSPPSEPLPSPKLQELSRMPGMSPKRSPAPQPPVSPLQNDRSSAFKFPSTACGPPPPPPPLTPHPVSCGTPPPLPPRRRRDSAAPPTPAPAPAPPTGSSSGSGPPPPLPPRPAPAPELLRPAHSTILQRRHHSGMAPRLPPKPTAAAVARGT